jgi:hypothetical protein
MPQESECEDRQIEESRQAVGERAKSDKKLLIGRQDSRTRNTVWERG